MKTMLVFPPQSDPCQPYSSIPYLTATLRREGHYVRPVDLNLLAYQYFTDIPHLSWSYQRCMETFNELNANSYLKTSEFNKYRYFARTYICGPSVLERLQEALNIFKDEKEFYNPNRYGWALRTVQRALEIASAPFYPSNLGLQNFSMQYSYESSNDILQAIEDQKENMFIDFYKSKFLPILDEENPKILGVSVTYPTQIIPAFTLASIVKQRYPDLPIVFGGATISRMFRKMKQVPQLLRDIDFIIIYEGETPLLKLVDAIENNTSLSNLPNLIIVDKEKITDTGINHIECLDELPCPDFEGLPLDQYWAPKFVPLLNISRGCYWGKCAFCTFSPSTWGKERQGKTYRCCSTDKIIADIQQISKKYDVYCFNFAIDAMPPAQLLKVANALIANDINITWDSEVRLEKGFTASVCRKLYDSGCRYLRFGFETASDRVARLMDKGTSLSISQEVIRNCAETGIAVCLMTFVGFPGETLEEAKITTKFLIDNSQNIAFVAIGEFILEDGSTVHQNPKAYGIAALYPPKGDDLATKYFYEKDEGMTHNEVRMMVDYLNEITDGTYTKRDLHIVGGQGHCHTSLYLSHYNLEDMLSISQQKREYKGNSLSMDSVVLPMMKIWIMPLRFDMKTVDNFLTSYAKGGVSFTSLYSSDDQILLNPDKSFMIYQPDKPDYFIYLPPDIAQWIFDLKQPNTVRDLIRIRKTMNGIYPISTLERDFYCLRKLVDCDMISIISP